MYEKILVPLDGSELAEKALDYAAELVDKTGAGLVLLHVCHSEGRYTRSMHQAYLDYTAERAGRRLAGAGAEATAVGSVVRVGDPATEVLRWAHENPASIIVMLTHGRSGISRWVMGSVADKVVRHSTVPVRLVRHVAVGRFPFTAGASDKRILVLLDGSEAAEQALPYAVDHAKMFDAELTLLRVCEAPFISSDYPEAVMALTWEEHVERITSLEEHRCGSYLNEVTARLQGLGLKVKAASLLGKPAQAILEYLDHNEFDLVAMTTHGRSGVARWTLGSVAGKVLGETRAPVLLIRAH